MGIVAEFFGRFFGDKGLSLEELARRLGKTPEAVRAVRVEYRRFTVPKKSGKLREIDAPSAELKALQRTILRKVLAKLAAHEGCTGFERGRSIATHAALHAGSAVLMRMDLKDFFPSTSEARVRQYFRKIGWSKPAADELVRLCCYGGGLPQGAPTSPRLSSVVNFGMDKALTRAAEKHGARYSRYADDLAFSFSSDDAGEVRALVAAVRWILRKSGYRVNGKKRIRILRQHQRQVLTGLVINDGVHLPRQKRRKLRAIEHRLKMEGKCSLTQKQVVGWRALEEMVERVNG
ncbi:MAG: RNA-directed DNA polymerase [Phycisphaeraceae bacterium]|nr:RNA-directed DNA polymerase [Phycisphaeraceae bacterium]